MLEIQRVRKQLSCSADFVAEKYRVLTVGCSHNSIILQDFLSSTLIVIQTVSLGLKGVVEGPQRINVLDQSVEY